MCILTATPSQRGKKNTNNNTVEKKIYTEPTLKVVEFKVERGFAGSGFTQAFGTQNLDDNSGNNQSTTGNSMWRWLDKDSQADNNL